MSGGVSVARFTLAAENARVARFIGVGLRQVQLTMRRGTAFFGEAEKSVLARRCIARGELAISVDEQTQLIREEDAWIASLAGGKEKVEVEEKVCGTGKKFDCEVRCFDSIIADNGRTEKKNWFCGWSNK